MKPPRILTIAGSDSSGGAGIQADIKTITMMGGYAMSAITAVTAQNTLGVRDIQAISAQLLSDQINACIEDIGVDAIKIGMLGSVENAYIVADILLVPKAFASAERGIPVVFDPVMIASSGSVLADEFTIKAFSRLMTQSTVVTPNLPELDALGGLDAVLKWAPAVLIKGGHGEGNVLIDRLVTRAGEVARWEDPRIDSMHTHGTGCTLASAIATGLGQGLDLVEAIARARQFVRAALSAAPGFGQGHGPMGHQAVR